MLKKDLIFALLILVIYSFGIIAIALYFYSKTEDNYLSENLSFSVLIPFKNEEKNLNNLILSLNKIEYPKNKIEFIFIDDNSVDKSCKVITDSDLRFNYKIIKNKNQGKKQALKTGLEHAKNEIIIHFDADIKVNPLAIKSYSGFFEQTDSKLVFGAVIFESGESFFEKMQELEIISLAGVAAGTAIAKNSVLLSGANLAYTGDLKKYFIESINKYESGDDMFFLQEVKKDYKNQIYFIKSKFNIVKTYAEKDIKSFFKQRIRWAGKTKGIKDYSIILFGLLSFLANVSLFVLLFNARYFIIAFAIKFIFEFIALSIFSSFFNVQKRLFFFPFVFFIYPFYVVFVAISSMFTKVSWK